MIQLRRQPEPTKGEPLLAALPIWRLRETIREELDRFRPFKKPLDFNPEDVVSIFGCYNNFSSVGSTHLSRVYKAFDEREGNPVAIKILRNYPTVSGINTVERFIIEALIGKFVKSKGVIPVFDFGTVREGIYFFVMEFLDGCNLAKEMDVRYRKRGIFTWEEIRGIILPLCETLATLHDLGITHMDIKPENVFLVNGSLDKSVRLFDFGAAQMPGEMHVGFTTGTAGYVAPERILNSASDLGPVDHRADIYSLGVLMYEMLCKSVPFPYEHFSAYRYERYVAPIFSDPEPPSKRKPDACIAPSIEQIILHALSRNPDNRFKDAREMAEAIRGVII